VTPGDRLIDSVAVASPVGGDGGNGIDEPVEKRRGQEP
jgi:hypothetical protein